MKSFFCNFGTTFNFLVFFINSRQSNVQPISTTAMSDLVAALGGIWGRLSKNVNAKEF